MATVPAPRRGEIWLVEFNPAVGAEIQKVRPALVVGMPSVGRLPLQIVVPVTDWKPRYASFPWFVEIPADAVNGLDKDSGADAFQVKSVSFNRFVRRIRAVTTAQLNEVAAAIGLCVGVP